VYVCLLRIDEKLINSYEYEYEFNKIRPFQFLKYDYITNSKIVRIRLLVNSLPQIFAIRKKLMMNKRILFLFLFIFRIAFVEKTRESDDEKRRRREGCREKNYHKLNAIK